MKIEAVDLFYLKMPEVLDIGDGSQDALLVRIRAGGLEGWGECEASPLTSIASYYAPMSHSACKPVGYNLIGRPLNDPHDIIRINQDIHDQSLDLLQANHTLSGIDIALWDLLGKRKGAPVYSLLGDQQAKPKLPYASRLFGDSPEETYQKGKTTAAAGYKAVKFGWGPFGRKSLREDIAQLKAAREGIGNEAYLMVDAGTVWNNNISAAIERLEALKEANTYWLEEPFVNGDLGSYKALSALSSIPLAGGEGCNNLVQAKAMIDYAGLAFIQIDAGRVGGITVAKSIADLSLKKNITYVNHTFTSHLALSASLQPYAGQESALISEYPVELKPLAEDISVQKIRPDTNGYIHLLERPGLGIDINIPALEKYLVDVEIRIGGRSIYHSPVF